MTVRASTALRPCPRSRRAGPARGFTLIEILVTILILLLGLLGVIGLQARAANVEFESYQRGQALAMAREMAARVSGSRGIVDGFKDDTVSSTDGSITVGHGVAEGVACVPGAGDPLAEAKFEACQWGEALQGVATKEGVNSVGAMIGARGCLIRVEPPNAGASADMFVVIVWQALKAGTEPPANTPASDCASGAFGAGLRRGVSVRVMVPDLVKPT